MILFFLSAYEPIIGPIIALGMGEKEDDLQKFNSEYFSNALMHS